jgi:hypothetical protein
VSLLVLLCVLLCVMSEIRRNIRAVLSAVATKSESQLEAALSMQCCEDYVADLTHLRASLPRWAHYAFKDQFLTHGRCSTQAAESNNITVSLKSHPDLLGNWASEKGRDGTSVGLSGSSRLCDTLQRSEDLLDDRVKQRAIDNYNAQTQLLTTPTLDVRTRRALPQLSSKAQKGLLAQLSKSKRYEIEPTETTGVFRAVFKWNREVEESQAAPAESAAPRFIHERSVLSRISQ